MDLKKRILEISYKHKTSHIGSCISCVDIIDKIYSKKKKDEIFCLGNSHAFLALAVILEKYENKDAEELFVRHGTHANRCLNDGIYISGGSLGIVESIALGLAISDINKNVYLLSSDGGAMEGIFWEVLRIKADNNINNLIWYINANGFGAYDKINIDDLSRRIYSFCSNIKIIETNFGGYSFLNGIDAHYKILKEENFKNA